MEHDISKYIDEYLDQAILCLSTLSENSAAISDLVTEIVSRINDFDSTVYWFGNGGSASDSEHLAAELAGRFALDRAPLRSFALTSNSSTVTAIANDYGYETVFARQIEGSARAKDVVIGISTSGRSKNVIQGLKAAQRIECLTVALTGKYTKDLEFVDYVFSVKNELTCHVQEAHITIGQAICGAIEKTIFGN